MAAQRLLEPPVVHFVFLRSRVTVLYSTTRDDFWVKKLQRARIRRLFFESVGRRSFFESVGRKAINPGISNRFSKLKITFPAGRL